MGPMRDRRWKALYEAALNLGMREDHAAHYATEAWQTERREEANLEGQLNAYYGGHNLS